MGYFGKIIKNTLIFAAVGALLALAAPTIAGWLGLSPVALGLIGDSGTFALGHAPLWTAAFFGAFGGIHAAIEPLVDGLLGSKKPASRHELVHTVRTVNGPSRAMSVAQEAEMDAPETENFRERFAPQSAEASFTDRESARPLVASNQTMFH